MWGVCANGTESVGKTFFAYFIHLFYPEHEIILEYFKRLREGGDV